jgi:hypothetical protein
VTTRAVASDAGGASTVRSEEAPAASILRTCGTTRASNEPTASL